MSKTVKLKILLSVALLLLSFGCQEGISKDHSQMTKAELFPIFSELCDAQDQPFQDDCYLDLMAYTKDASYCDKMGFVIPQSHCLNLYAELLNGTWPPEKVESIHSKLFKLHNLTVENCNEEGAASQRDECFINLAVGLKDLNLCSEVKIEKRQNYCAMQVASELSDSSLCKGLLIYENKCYGSVARKSNNRQICKNISDEFMRLSCHFNIAS